VAALAACHRPRPVEPTTITRDRIAAAEGALRRRDYPAALAAYQQAVDDAAARDDRAGEVYARRERASALIMMDDLDGAAADLERVVALRPDDAPAWHDLGIVRHGRGDLDGAAAALRRARALRPHDPRPRIALAALLWKRGDRDGAAREYRALLDLDLPTRLRSRVEWALAQLAPAGP